MNFFISSDFAIWVILRWFFFASLSRISRPRSTLFSRSSVLIHALIFDRARVVTANFSQSLLGWAPGWVMISMVSPFWSLYFRGTMALFTLAPTHWFPTSVWMLYAKSMGVAPWGNAFTSPSGVNT